MLTQQPWFDFTSYEVSEQLAKEEAESRNILAVRAYQRTCNDSELNKHNSDARIPEPPKKWILGLIVISATYGRVIFPGAVQSTEDLVSKYISPEKPALPEEPGFLRPLDRNNPKGPWSVKLCTNILDWKGKRSFNPHFLSILLIK